MEPSDTRERILDAAEQAFANLGFEATSVRQIARMAKVNLATLYYHFGSKEGLLREVLKRRFDPVHEQQLSRLEQLEQKPDITAADIIEALLVPPLRFACQLGKNSEVIGQLIGRMLTEPQPVVNQLLRAQFERVYAKCLQMLKKALPWLADKKIHWRMQLMWGGIAFILCQPGRVREKTQGQCNPLDFEEAFSEMFLFFKGGFEAPAGF